MKKQFFLFFDFHSVDLRVESYAPFGLEGKWNETLFTRKE